MAARKVGLGRGLSALMEEMGPGPAPVAAASSGQTSLALASIDPNPRQPRTQFDSVELNELADSIRIKGVLQPILVRPAPGDRYEIVAGERRWRASQLAGLHEIPVVIRAFTDSDGFEAAIIENVQRADLNPLEEALGYQRLVQDFGHTQEMVAAVTGKARSHVANLLRLIDLPEEARAMLRDGLLSVGHAKAVLQAKDPAALARAITERGLTVRQAEEAARKSHAAKTGAEPRMLPRRDNDLEMLESQISETLGLQVAIKARGNSGTVTVKYSDLDQLDTIIGRLQR